MPSSHTPAPRCPWFSALAKALDPRSARWPAVLVLGVILARGRRTVSCWIRAAGLSSQSRRCYATAAAVGRRTERVAVCLLPELIKPLVADAPRLVPALDDIPFPNRFDSVDNNVNFAGAWGTYRPKKGQAIDAYYLMLDNTSRLTQLNIPRGNFTRHTVGGRYSGNEGNVLFDTETAFQFGSQNGRDVFAAMTTQGLGYNWKDAPLAPTVWAYYDYASGGGETRGTAHTFHQLFPFGHYYMGWLDLVGRQNIHDLNFHLYLYPTKWVTTWLQFHNFWLADSRDALYNAAGVPIRRDPTGRAGSFVGQEVDVVLNFHLSKHTEVLTGYCHLFGGEFLRNTASRTQGADAGFFFTQLSYRW